MCRRCGSSLEAVQGFNWSCPPNPQFTTAKKQFVGLCELSSNWIERGRDLAPTFVARVLQGLVGDSDELPVREPHYRGTALSIWTEYLTDADPNYRQLAYQAIRAIGLGALPSVEFLLFDDDAGEIDREMLAQLCEELNPDAKPDRKLVWSSAARVSPQFALGLAIATRGEVASRALYRTEPGALIQLE